MDKDHILLEIKRTTEENGGAPLGVERFEKETGIKRSHWSGRYWLKWGDAIEEAGYSYTNKMQTAYADDFLIKKLIDLILELGHFPTSDELRFKRHHDKSFPSKDTFGRFNGKGNLIETVIKYCRTNKTHSSVIDICNEALPKTKPSQEIITDSKNIEYGFVYLMKSGKRFKIGRSNNAERREYELGIILPEELELVHKIITDYPSGIEKYWHGRFQDKRKRGEWFDLSAGDVKAFKSRKTM